MTRHNNSGRHSRTVTLPQKDTRMIDARLDAKINDRDELLKIVEVFKANGGLENKRGCYSKSFRELGMASTSFRNMVHRAGVLGMFGTGPEDLKPVVPGFQIKEITTGPDGKTISIKQSAAHGDVFEMPEGQKIRGVSSFVDAEGRVVYQWIKTKEDDEGVNWFHVFENAFKDFKSPHELIKKPKSPDQDFLNLIPCNDWHINMLCWWREVGESWDLNIAEKVIGDAIEDIIARTRSAGTAIVLGGGDLMHNDDNTNRTAKSHNVLDADGRYAKGVEVAQRLKVRTIDTALKHNGKVVVRILKGNHDEQSAIAIAHFLKAWYRHEPRVTVDLDQSLFWFYQFGKVMLAATHGHAAKLARMPQIMAARFPAMWGATAHRYAHGFHFHHKEKTITEDGGAIMECHQAPIPQDEWNYGEGFISARSMQTITYHKDKGERGRVIDVITGTTGQLKD